MAKDKCIICGVETPYDYETSVDVRMWYVETAGQLCARCYNGNDCKIEIPCSIILDAPSNEALGEMVKHMYFTKSNDNA
jgi:hypothetical protein